MMISRERVFKQENNKMNLFHLKIVAKIILFDYYSYNIPFLFVLYQNKI